MEEILNKKIDIYFNDMVKDLQEFIKIRSILDENAADEKHPFGPNIDKAIRWILKKGALIGFRTKYLDGYAGYIEFGNGREMVGILGHVDMVPEGSGWSVPPFIGLIKEDKLYGRGSIDDKGPILAVLYGLKAIKESGLPISRRARLIVGGDEETGGRCIKHYLEKEELPVYGFSPDAEFPIIYAEKGILRFEFQKHFKKTTDKGPSIIRIFGGIRVNVVPDYAEALINGVDLGELESKIKTSGFSDKLQALQTPEGVIVKAKGISAHASYPQNGVNAIQILFKLLSMIDLDSNDVKSFIDSIVDKFNMEVNGEKLGIACKDDISGDLTINMGTVDFSKERGIIKFDMRYPVTADGNKIIERLKEIASDIKVDFIINQHKLPLYVDPKTEFIKKLQKVYKEMTQDEPKLLAIGGGIYCRYVKNTVSFGPVFPGQIELAHQKDEYISLKDLKKITKIYTQAIYELIK